MREIVDVPEGSQCTICFTHINAGFKIPPKNGPDIPVHGIRYVCIACSMEFGQGVMVYYMRKNR